MTGDEYTFGISVILIGNADASVRGNASVSTEVAIYSQHGPPQLDAEMMNFESDDW